MNQVKYSNKFSRQQKAEVIKGWLLALSIGVMSGMVFIFAVSGV